MPVPRNRGITTRTGEPVKKEIIDAKLRRTSVAHMGLAGKYGTLVPGKTYKFEGKLYWFSEDRILHEL